MGSKLVGNSRSIDIRNLLFVTCGRHFWTAVKVLGNGLEDCCGKVCVFLIYLLLELKTCIKMFVMYLKLLKKFFMSPCLFYDDSLIFFTYLFYFLKFFFRTYSLNTWFAFQKSFLFIIIYIFHIIQVVFPWHFCFLSSFIEDFTGYILKKEIALVRTVCTWDNHCDNSQLQIVNWMPVECSFSGSHSNLWGVEYY